MIRTAVILAAGMNSRMYPIAKVIPKAMLPLGNLPAIHLLARECRESGIKRIIIVQRKGNNLIEDYFRTSRWERSWLKKLGKKNALKWLDEIASFKVEYVEQSMPLGEAHALRQALPLIKNEEALAVIFADILYKSKKPALKQVIEEFKRRKLPIISNGRFILLRRQLEMLADTKSFSGEPGKGKTVASLFEKEKEISYFKVKGKYLGIGSLAEYANASSNFSLL